MEEHFAEEKVPAPTFGAPQVPPAPQPPRPTVAGGVPVPPPPPQQGSACGGGLPPRCLGLDEAAGLTRDFFRDIFELLNQIHRETTLKDSGGRAGLP